MSAIVKDPVYAHSFSSIERDEDGCWKASCSCRSFWTDVEKQTAMTALHRHLGEHAKQLRKLRREVNGAAAHSSLPVEVSGDVWTAACSCGESFDAETPVKANRLRNKHIHQVAVARRVKGACRDCR